jgi:SNF2 family DNA or RNA helicase
MRIHIRREHGAALIINLLDPTMRRFGKLEFRAASALAPLLDSSLQVRLRPSLDARKRIASEVPGSPTSGSLKLTILIYAPRKHVIQIGRKLAQHAIKLEDTSLAGLGVDLVNPHSVSSTSAKPMPSSSTFGPNGFAVGAGYVNRTNEEVRADVLNMFDSITKTEDLPEMQQDARITTELLKHQKQGLHFMTEREKIPLPNAENNDNGFVLWRSKHKDNGTKIYYNVITGHEASHRPPPVRGGILADMMGLGKTLNILSLVVGSMDDASIFGTLPPPRIPQRPLVRNSKATLLVCPLSTVANWEDQIKSHIAPGTFTYYIYHGTSRIQDINELAKYDMVVTSYHTLAAEVKKSGSKRPIFQTNFFRIVLDEAHQVRTQSTSMSIAVCEIEAQRRWAVSGTPIQNRLEDLGALIKFLRIKPFDQKGAFAQFIIAPFKQADPEILPKLRLLVDSITLRRQKDHITLPERTDKIVRLEFSDREKKTYQFFLSDSQAKIKAISSAGLRFRGKQTARVLQNIMRLRKLCAHGEEMLTDEDRKLMTGISFNNAIDLTDEEDGDQTLMSPQQAFEMLELLRESDANTCSICNKVIVPDSNEEDEGFEVRRNTNTMGYLMACNELFCPGCFPGYLEEVAQVVGEDNYLDCPRCQNWGRNVCFELKAAEFVEWEQAKARVRANPKLAKQLGYYHGPHTKTQALVTSLLNFKEWSANNPDEARIKRSVIPNFLRMWSH